MSVSVHGHSNTICSSVKIPCQCASDVLKQIACDIVIFDESLINVRLKQWLVLPSRYVSSALITQTQPYKRSYITASVLIRFINVMQPNW